MDEKSKASKNWSEIVVPDEEAQSEKGKRNYLMGKRAALDGVDSIVCETATLSFQKGYWAAKAGV